jgi:hypothetical protein
MFSHRVTRFVAAGAALVAVAVGGLAIGNSSSSSGSSGTTNAAQPAASGQVGPRAGGPGQARPHQGGPGQAAPDQSSQSGQIPQNWRPGTGTLITGAAADKVKALALAKYPGTVNRVLKLSDGSYVAHMFATTGPHHVFVSKDFKITGTA